MLIAAEDPPSRQLSVVGLQVAGAGPPINKTLASLIEAREAVAKLKGGMAPGISNISLERRYFTAQCTRQMLIHT